MAERSPHQQRIIRNYYQNQDQILLTRLQEAVTELYLAEGKSQARLWKNAAAAMQKLGVPPARIAHLLEQRKPELLARLVEELLAKK